jgi:peptide deformylase
MIYPIVAYGDPVLRKKADDIAQDYLELPKLVADMFETMYASSGVGLAAPHIGKPIRLFVIDSAVVLQRLNEKYNSQEEEEDDDEDDDMFRGEVGVKKVFINPRQVNLAGDEWVYNEGCLSIPNVREDVTRPDEITLEYLDENFEPYVETFTGFTGRVIQHEYDHIEGILFTDRLKPLKKRLLKPRLEKISRGDVKVDYKMKFPLRK